MHSNQLIQDKLQNALTTLFDIPFEDGSRFSSMEFSDTASEKYHLDILCDFANNQNAHYHGIHLAAHLKSQTKHALASGFTINGRVCAICKIEGEYLPCLANRKGQVVEPLSTGLELGSDILSKNILYGWYIFKRKKL